MSDQIIGYTGRDNLEVMLEAEKYNAWLCDQVVSRAQRSDRVLDFGAGSGTFALMVRQHGLSVTCVELDDILRSKLMSSGLPAVASLGELTPASFDFIYTFNVLEHIEDDRAQVRELARVLKPGGTLLIYVPAFQVLYSEMDRKVGHFRRYRRDSLAGIVEAGGLKVVYCRYADSLGFLATIAYKMIGAKDGSIDSGSIRLYDRYIFPLSRTLDAVAGLALGKNVMAVAVKPS
jgi:SAM-dependent methyltransferase